MNIVEFKTMVHNGMIEVPKNNPEIKDKEVKVILMWDEKPAEDKGLESKGNLDEVFGLWKKKDIDLGKTREQQWGRKTK